jgi:diacylglycerol kinase
MKAFLQSFKWAQNGLKTVWIEEKNFRIEVYMASLAMGLGLGLDLSNVEFIIIIFACLFVLMAEIVNTAIEDLCNKIEPRDDFYIGKIKDTMASFVLLGAIGSVATAVIILLPKILEVL